MSLQRHRLMRKKEKEKKENTILKKLTARILLEKQRVMEM